MSTKISLLPLTVLLKNQSKKAEQKHVRPEPTSRAARPYLAKKSTHQHLRVQYQTRHGRPRPLRGRFHISPSAPCAGLQQKIYFNNLKIKTAFEQRYILSTTLNCSSLRELFRDANFRTQGAFKGIFKPSSEQTLYDKRRVLSKRDLVFDNCVV